LEFGPALGHERVFLSGGVDGNTQEVVLTDGVGVCSVVRTSDALLVIQKRRNNHVRYPGWFHVCGGMLETETLNRHIIVDPFGWMQSELHEELGIEIGFISDMQCMGIVRDEHNARPELVFVSHLSVSAGRFAHSQGPEHSDLVLLDDKASILQQFLAEQRDLLVPSGMACLLLYGKSNFPSNWYSDTVALLKSSKTRRGPLMESDRR
jgi:hypothetical protein